MAKSKIVTTGGLNFDISAGSTPIIGQKTQFTPVPKITGVKPCGSQVLIEFLTVQELANTNIAISENTDLKLPLQGYIRATGPSFKSDDWGFKVGDRVLISGSGVPAPNYDSCNRDRFFMEPYAVKSVLCEE
jgi:co-chaperonin GroES (HSP10)